jgi:hypothetical protein
MGAKIWGDSEPRQQTHHAPRHEAGATPRTTIAGHHPNTEAGSIFLSLAAAVEGYQCDTATPPLKGRGGGAASSHGHCDRYIATPQRSVAAFEINNLPGISPLNVATPNCSVANIRETKGAACNWLVVACLFGRKAAPACCCRATGPAARTLP